MNKTLCVALLVLCGGTTPARANETVSYSYDAQGRLVQVVHTGSVNNGQSTTYEHDKADNRASVTVTGAGH